MTIDLKQVALKKTTIFLRNHYLWGMKEFLKAYKKTGNEMFLDAAKDCGKRSKELKDELTAMK